MMLINKMVLSSALMVVSSYVLAESTNVYDPTVGSLSLPSVNVPSGNGDFQRYSAILTQLPADPALPNQMTFSLQKGAELSQIPRDLAYFTPSAGKVAFPVSVLGANFYWVEMMSMADGIGPVKFVLDLATGVKEASKIKLLTVSKSGSEAGRVRITGAGGRINCGNDSCWAELGSSSDVVLTAEGVDTKKTAMAWTGCDSSTANTCTVKPGNAGIRSVEVKLNDIVPSFCFKKEGEVQVALSSTFGSSPSPGEILDFGSVQMGTSALSNVTIKGPAITASDDLCVQSMGLSGPNVADFKIIEPTFPQNPEYLTFKPKTATLVLVQCTPSAESMRQAVLTLKTNDPSQPIISYTMKCKGIKEAQPSYWSDPRFNTELDFKGSARNQETTPIRIFVSNRGQLPLDAYKIKVSGTNASDFLFKGPDSLTLQPNEPKKFFEISCKPTDLGARTGLLELGSNDPDHLTISHPLKCEGITTCLGGDFAPKENINTEIVSEVGRGYDSSYDQFKPESCLNGSISQIGHEEAFISETVVDNLTEVEKSFSTGGSAKVGWWIFAKARAAANFIASAKETDRSTTFVYRFRVFLPNKQFNINQNDPLSAIGKKVINVPSCWKNACGSYYISQIEQGTDLYVFVKLLFSDSTAKANFSTDASAKASFLFGLVKAQAAVSAATASTETTSYSGVSVFAFQRGGDAVKLANIFNAGSTTGNNNGMDSSITCSISHASTKDKDFTACKEVMNNILVYAKTDFMNGAKHNPMNLGYIFSRYDELSIGSPTVDFEASPAVIEARQALADAYNRELENYATLRELLNGTLTTNSRSLVNQLLGKVDYNIEVIRSMAAWCFSDLSRCVDKQRQAIAFEIDTITLSDNTKVKGMLKIYNRTVTATGTLGVDNVTLEGNRYKFGITDDDKVPNKNFVYLIKQ